MNTTANEQLLAEIREANLAYLMLAQHIIRQDKAQALFRLGVSEEIAAMIAALSPQQILKIASSNMLMCRFRFDDDVVWGLLTSHAKTQNAGALHAGIIMAAKVAEVV